MKYLGALFLALGLFGIVAFAADTMPGMGSVPGMGSMPTTTPSTSQPAMPACCGDKCKQMVKCCTTDTADKVTCQMGGSCCIKKAN